MQNEKHRFANGEIMPKITDKVREDVVDIKLSDSARTELEKFYDLLESQRINPHFLEKIDPNGKKYISSEDREIAYNIAEKFLEIVIKSVKSYPVESEEYWNVRNFLKAVKKISEGEEIPVIIVRNLPPTPEESKIPGIFFNNDNDHHKKPETFGTYSHRAPYTEIALTYLISKKLHIQQFEQQYIDDEGIERGNLIHNVTPKLRDLESNIASSGAKKIGAHTEDSYRTNFKDEREVREHFYKHHLDINKIAAKYKLTVHGLISQMTELSGEPIGALILTAITNKQTETPYITAGQLKEAINHKFGEEALIELSKIPVALIPSGSEKKNHGKIGYIGPMFKLDENNNLTNLRINLVSAERMTYAGFDLKQEQLFNQFVNFMNNEIKPSSLKITEDMAVILSNTKTLHMRGSAIKYPDLIAYKEPIAKMAKYGRNMARAYCGEKDNNIQQEIFKRLSERSRQDFEYITR